MQMTAKQKMVLLVFLLCVCQAPLWASDGPDGSSSWDSDLQSSLDSISDTPDQSESSADAALSQESSSEVSPAVSAEAPVNAKTRFAGPPTMPEALAAEAKTPAPQGMSLPSRDSMIQRKAADLRGRVERLEDRVAENERDIRSLSERVETLHRQFDEYRRRR